MGRSTIRPLRRILPLLPNASIAVLAVPGDMRAAAAVSETRSTGLRAWHLVRVDFPSFGEKPLIGGLACWRLVSASGQVDSNGHFGAFVSGLQIRFHGKQRRVRRTAVRIPSYCAGRPRIRSATTTAMRSPIMVQSVAYWPIP